VKCVGAVCKTCEKLGKKNELRNVSNDIRSLLEGFCLDKAFLITGRLHIVSETEISLDELSAPALPYDLMKADCLPDDARIASLNPLVLDKTPEATGDFDAIIMQFKSVSDAWIVNTRDCQVIPVVKSMTDISFDGASETKELHNGTGGKTLYLNRKPIVEVKALYAGCLGAAFSHSLADIEVHKEEGTLVTNGCFPKGDGNFTVEYSYGHPDVPDEIKRAVSLFTASLTLGFIASKTGGGSSVSTQGYSRSFGNRGKFTEIRNNFDRWAHVLLKPYYSGITIL
jgi:hypothetical protein